MKVAQSSPTLYEPNLYSPRNSPDQNTGVGCHALLQWIVPNQGSNYTIAEVSIGQFQSRQLDYLIVSPLNLSPHVWNFLHQPYILLLKQIHSKYFSSVQSLSRVRLFATP